MLGRGFDSTGKCCIVRQCTFGTGDGAAATHTHAAARGTRVDANANARQSADIWLSLKLHGGRAW